MNGAPSACSSCSSGIGVVQKKEWCYVNLLQVGNRLRPIRQHADARVWAKAGAALGDSLGDVAAGREQGLANLRVAQAVAIDEYIGMQLDLGLDLDLPLIM